MCKIFPKYVFFSNIIIVFSNEQPDLYDRIDQASVLRQEQMLKAQSLQSNSLDGGSR